MISDVQLPAHMLGGGTYAFVVMSHSGATYASTPNWDTRCQMSMVPFYAFTACKRYNASLGLCKAEEARLNLPTHTLQSMGINTAAIANMSLYVPMQGERSYTRRPP